MRILSSIAGGFAGACAVTLLNELVKRYDKEAPRIDLLGQEVVAEAHEAFDSEVPPQNQLYKEALSADLLSNTIYFSIAGANDKQPEVQGGMQGILAGLSAVYAPGLSNALNAKHTGETDKKKILTTAYYFIGGVVAGKVMHWINDLLDEQNEGGNKLLKKLNADI
ncbi:hypothetical protein [Aridibaculum aurantiacum]|uniref:hypothetical protein n=1 Tax=Aridibaculum aurantiacum TaxID=2810307 RepID=UPI001A97AC68|nr:hypothetical protein [Aridibaculum aurantiacum]